MSNSSFNQSQSPYASELGAGLVKKATQQQVNDRQADDNGVPLFVTPDRLPENFDTSIDLASLSPFIAGSPSAVGFYGGNAVALAYAYVSGGFKTANSGADKFNGFVNQTAPETNVQAVDYLQIADNSAYSSPAGLDRYVLVFVDNQTANVGHNVTNITYGGVAMTLLFAVPTAGITGGVQSGGFYVYGVAIGTSLVSTSAVVDITFNGVGTFSPKCFTLTNVDQLTPIIHQHNSSFAPTTSPSAAVGGLFYSTVGKAFGAYFSQNVSGFTGSVLGSTLLTVDVLTPLGPTVRAFKTTTSNWSGYLGLVMLKPSPIPGGQKVSVQNIGVVPGFTGLSVGELYYLSAVTGGGVSTIRNGNPIGVAKSATELQILQTF